MEQSKFGLHIVVINMGVSVIQGHCGGIQLNPKWTDYMCHVDS